MKLASRQGGDIVGHPSPFTVNRCAAPIVISMSFDEFTSGENCSSALSVQTNARRQDHNEKPVESDESDSESFLQLSVACRPCLK